MKKVSKKFFDAVVFLPELSEEKLAAVLADMSKDAHLELREVGKLCPVCDAEYFASGPFFKKNSAGLDTTYCVDCGKQEVWAYLAKCWCGMTICPRDAHCGYHGHRVCRYECRPCPGWHDYTERFAEKSVSYLKKSLRGA